MKNPESYISSSNPYPNRENLKKEKICPRKLLKPSFHYYIVIMNTYTSGVQNCSSFSNSLMHSNPRHFLPQSSIIATHQFNPFIQCVTHQSILQSNRMSVCLKAISSGTAGSNWQFSLLAPYWSLGQGMVFSKKIRIPVFKTIFDQFG